VVAAMNFYPDPAVAAVDGLCDILRCNGLPEAGPAGAGIVFVLAAEQGNSRARQNIDAGLLVVPVGIAERRFGAVFTHYMILIGAQHGAPFGISALNGKLAGHFCMRRKGAIAGFGDPAGFGGLGWIG